MGPIAYISDGYIGEELARLLVGAESYTFSLLRLGVGGSGSGLVLFAVVNVTLPTCKLIGFRQAVSHLARGRIPCHPIDGAWGSGAICQGASMSGNRRVMLFGSLAKMHLSVHPIDFTCS